MDVCFPVMASVIGKVIQDGSLPESVVGEDDEVLDVVMVWFLVSEVVQPAESRTAMRHSARIRIRVSTRCIYRVRIFRIIVC